MLTTGELRQGIPPNGESLVVGGTGTELPKTIRFFKVGERRGFLRRLFLATKN